MLCSLHIFVAFSAFFLQLISIALWLEKILHTISIFLSLLRLALVPNIWSIFENILCALEENVYSADLGWSVLDISINSIWSSFSIRSTISLLTFYLDDLSTDVIGVLKSPIIIVLLLISPFRSVNSSFMYFGAPVLGAYIFMCYVLFMEFPF